MLPTKAAFRSLCTSLALACAALIPCGALAQVPSVSGTQTVSGKFGTAVYTVVLSASVGPQADNPGDEFVEVLPSDLTLVSATATSGTALAAPAINTVSWNGAIPAGGSVTITITATITAPRGTVISAQGTIAYDMDSNGTNESTAVTDDPAAGGASDPTVFRVQDVEITATQALTGTLTPGATITLTVVLTNSGTAAQADNANSEFIEVLPPSLTLVSADATSGTAVANPPGDEDGGMVTWDGPLAPGGTVTITITATIHPSAAGQIVSLQGFAAFDRNVDGTNEASAPTDDAGTAAALDANTFTLGSAILFAPQTVAGVFAPNSPVRYTVAITNNGNSTQTDNAGDEFTEVLPAAVHLVSATASLGSAVANVGTNTVTWNGSIDAGATVTITINATVDAAVMDGQVVSAQGSVSYDFDVDGVNESGALTFAPPLGEDAQPTVFTVRTSAAFIAASRDAAFAFGTGLKPFSIDVLANDHADGVTFTVQSATNGTAGNVTVNADGTLLYTPTSAIPAGGDTFSYTVSDGLGGTYVVTVTVRDFGTTAATFNGVVQSALVAANATSGLVKLTLAKGGALTASLTIGGVKFTGKGTLDSLGVARFGKASAAELVLTRNPRSLPPFHVTFHLDDTSDVSSLSGGVTVDGNDFAAFTAGRAFYNASTRPVAAPLLGTYTVLLPPAPEPNGGLAATKYPQGTGYGTVKVAKSGKVTLNGFLADGAKISYSNVLDQTNSWPIYLPLYSRKGSLSGTAHFRDNAAANTDLDALALNWFAPANAKAARYPDGWPSGIIVDLLGSAFTVPAAGTALLPGLNSAGDADFTLSAGDLAAPIVVNGTIDGSNRVTFSNAPADAKLKLVIAKTGLISGSFVHPVSKKSTSYKGAILQRQQRAAGYFLGPAASGNVALAPH